VSDNRTSVVPSGGAEESFGSAGRPGVSGRNTRHGSGRRFDDARRNGALSVVVDERGIDSALRTFKKLIAKEGLLKDLKRRQHYEKPGERRRRKRREALRRLRRQEARSRRYRR